MPRKTNQSRSEYDKRRAKARKELAQHDGSEWADYRPRRDFGVFAIEHRIYRHNGRAFPCT